MPSEPTPPPLDSDALRANLLETAVGEVAMTSTQRTNRFRNDISQEC